MIRHLYLDVDRNGPLAIEAMRNSGVVPLPNYVLETFPEEYQVVWKVEGIAQEEAETLQRAMVREFGGDPAATDSTRVLRLPGFANKKYDQDFYVQARVELIQTYPHRDFKLQTDWQDAPRHHNEEPARRHPAPDTALSQSEHDWAYAKRALARGNDPEEVMRRIADFRASDKADPGNYTRHTVSKAQAELLLKEESLPNSQGRETNAHGNQDKYQEFPNIELP